MNATNLLKRAACLFSPYGPCAPVSAQSRFADAMRQAYAKPERIYQFYVQHQPDSIYKQGEDVFSPYLSSDQFAAQLRAMEERLGDPVEASMWEMQQMAGCEIYSRKITFPRHSATLNVVFDPSGSLFGLYFLPMRRRYLPRRSRPIISMFPTRSNCQPASLCRRPRRSRVGYRSLF